MLRLALSYLEVDIGVLAGGLASRGTIKVPDGKLLRKILALLLGKSLEQS